MVQQIKDLGFVSYEMRSGYFKKMSLPQIREWLEFRGLSRHTPIETYSTEVALLTPNGVLMQVKPSDNNALCMWGGEINPGEESTDGAVRELFEELHIVVAPSKLQFREFIRHAHTYSNGNVVIYNTYRYSLEYGYVPKIKLDPESSGIVFISAKSPAADVSRILPVQQKFIMNLADKKSSD